MEKTGITVEEASTPAIRIGWRGQRWLPGCSGTCATGVIVKSKLYGYSEANVLLNNTPRSFITIAAYTSSPSCLLLGDLVARPSEHPPHERKG